MSESEQLRMNGSSFFNGGCCVSVSLRAEDGGGGRHMLEDDECGQLTATPSPSHNQDTSKQIGRRRRRRTGGRMCEWQEGEEDS
mmetsp:Transcript_20027/g.33756  ORF Transcript_20027/g.33756 Transcript_20027/m.33756 type:complete len:84 (+) Transcript_20027:754-1005(+)